MIRVTLTNLLGICEQEIDGNMLNRNLNSRNFGLQSRDMVKAAKNALKSVSESFGSIDTQTERFSVFAKWLKENHQIKDLRWIEKHHLVEYAEHLVRAIEHGILAVATVHNRISAINTVMSIARTDKAVWVAPSDHFPNRTGVATVNRAPTAEQYDRQKVFLNDQTHGDRLQLICDLGKELGLRFEEATKLNAKTTLRDAERIGVIRIADGTKGGCPRSIPIESRHQLRVLRDAAELQGKDRSLIPSNMSYAEFRNLAYKEVQHSPIRGFHPNRHYYAQARYEVLIGAKCPLSAGVSHGAAHHHYLSKELGISFKEAKILDKTIRTELARELGHNRPEITNSYVG
ncbi:MAG: integrase domain-containing protein [Candidatus Thiodiazotropha sp.]